MDPANLYDPLAGAIVVGGTLLATVLRCGFADSRAALGALARLPRSRFTAERWRAQLAGQVREVRQNGLLRARPQRLGDAEIDDATDALIGKRSVNALMHTHEAHRGERLALDGRAISTLVHAAELAPVFGLAGTLISLSQLPHHGLTHGDFGGAIAMAVLTTLYGLLLSHIVLAPLARLVERSADAEDREREQVIAWLAAQVEDMVVRRGEPGLAQVS